jgi:predicted Zn finger-like uncharacterized protein
MPINVTCPSCLTRFAVNDKFAGKSGPCPKCKTTIKIPEKDEEVVIHAPVDAAPKDSKGKSVIKPLRREDVKLSLTVIVAASLTAIVAIGVALAFGISRTAPPAWLLAAGAILLAVPLVATGYWFLHTDELQGYQGKELWVRSAACAAVFALAWLVYIFVPPIIGSHSTVAETTPVEMALLIAVMIGLGTAAAVLSLELEIGQAVMLYMLYFIITFVLAWMAGAPLSQFIPGTSQAGQAPGVSTPQPTQPAPTETKRPPTLLQ